MPRSGPSAPRAARTVGGIVLMAVAAGCATPPTRIREIGPETYEITRQTQRMSDRSDGLKVDAELEAAAHCSQQGRAMAVLDSRTTLPDPPAPATATVQFRCVPR